MQANRLTNHQKIVAPCGVRNAYGTRRGAGRAIEYTGNAVRIIYA